MILYDTQFICFRLRLRPSPLYHPSHSSCNCLFTMYFVSGPLPPAPPPPHFSFQDEDERYEEEEDEAEAAAAQAEKEKEEEGRPQGEL